MGRSADGGKRARRITSFRGSRYGEQSGAIPSRCRRGRFLPFDSTSQKGDHVYQERGFLFTAFLLAGSDTIHA